MKGINLLINVLLGTLFIVNIVFITIYEQVDVGIWSAINFILIIASYFSIKHAIKKHKQKENIAKA